MLFAVSRPEKLLPQLLYEKKSSVGYSGMAQDTVLRIAFLSAAAIYIQHTTLTRRQEIPASKGTDSGSRISQPCSQLQLI